MYLVPLCLQASVLALTRTPERHPPHRARDMINFRSWVSRTKTVFHYYCEAPLPDTLWHNHDEISTPLHRLATLFIEVGWRMAYLITLVPEKS